MAGQRKDSQVTKASHAVAILPPMKKTICSSFRALLVAACISNGVSPASATSSAELLEKGIYNEETKGDLDSAITIYQQLVGDAKAAQTLAAEAQFRLGKCYLKENRAADATSAFEKVIRDFPQEKELVAKARTHLPTQLAPACAVGRLGASSNGDHHREGDRHRDCRVSRGPRPFEWPPSLAGWCPDVCLQQLGEQCGC